MIDSSVVLATLNGEPGAGVADDLMPSALLSTVNLGEVVTKLTERGVPRSAIREMMGRLSCEFVPCDAPQAMLAGFLHELTRGRNVSLGDRVCMALALMRGLPVYTADRPWTSLGLPIDIRLIR